MIINKLYNYTTTFTKSLPTNIARNMQYCNIASNLLPQRSCRKGEEGVLSQPLRSAWMAWKYRKKAAEELAKRLPEQIKKAVGDLPVNEGAKRTDTKKGRPFNLPLSWSGLLDFDGIGVSSKYLRISNLVSFRGLSLARFWRDFQGLGRSACLLRKAKGVGPSGRVPCRSAPWPCRAVGRAAG